MSDSLAGGPGASSVLYTYDDLADAEGEVTVTTLSYDDSGRRVLKETEGGARIEYTYDADGRLAERRFVSETKNIRHVYGYDQAGNEVRVDVHTEGSDGPGAAMPGRHVHNWCAYDSFGNPTACGYEDLAFDTIRRTDLDYGCWEDD